MIFRHVANTEMFLTISYDEILSLIKDENLFAKEDMVKFSVFLTCYYH